MKITFICSGLLLALAASASVTNQFAFAATGLPSTAGQFNRSYISTDNPNVTAMLALYTNSGGGLLPGGASSEQSWNFSGAQQSGETVLRTDIIAPSAGTDGGSFPAATYAEQDSSVSGTTTNQIAWRYYSLTNQGRLYYGSYALNSGADGAAVFVPPTLDVPAIVTNGQTWTRSTGWNTLYGGVMPVTYSFSDTAVVDAYGYLSLPAIGTVPALRVHEVHVYTGTAYPGYYFSFIADLHTNQYYYWLVPGLGVAVQVFQFGNNVYDPGLAYTNEVERMYSASYFTNSPAPSAPPLVRNLFIQRTGGAVRLYWNSFTNSTSYEVLYNGSLAGTNWQTLGLTSVTNWTDTFTPTQRFYRVVGTP